MAQSSENFASKPDSPLEAARMRFEEGSPNKEKKTNRLEGGVREREAGDVYYYFDGLRRRRTKKKEEVAAEKGGSEEVMPGVFAAPPADGMATLERQHRRRKKQHSQSGTRGPRVIAVFIHGTRGSHRQAGCPAEQQVRVRGFPSCGATSSQPSS
ncbi:hypothetical protein MRX96_013288 [Rhipicephalus microplus]